MSVLKGNDLILFTTNGATNTVLARATSCDIEISNEPQEITSKSSGDFKEFIAGRIEWSVSTGGLVDFTDTNGISILNTALFAGSDIQIRVGIATKGTDTKPTGLDTTKNYYKGTVKVTSLSINTGNAGELSSYTAKLTGTGQLEFVTGA